MNEIVKIEIVKKDFQGDGSTVKFEYQKETASQSGFVVLFEGKYYAYLNQCKHMPIELDYKPNEFMDDQKAWIVCSTHGAIYHPTSGECMSGPCYGEKLQKLNVIELNDVLWIETF
jgi:nitrite reductase/ring-hydroxylating ferredoxin subunit